MIAKKQLQKLATNQGVYTKGIGCYERGQVSRVSSETVAKGYQLSAYVEEVEGTQRTQVTLDAKGEKVLGYECTCVEHWAYPGICRHVVATLLSQDEKDVITSTTAPMVQMENIALESLIQQYTESQYSLESSEQQVRESLVPIELHPYFTFEEDGKVSLSLAIEQGKVCDIENMRQLALDFQNERTRTYTRGLTVTHCLETCQRGSRMIVKCLIEALQQGKLKEEMTLELDKPMFDAFFEKYQDSKEQGLEWRVGAPEKTFVLRQEGEVFVLGLREDQEGQMLKLLYDASYGIYEGVLYKCHMQWQKRVMPVLRALMKSQQQEIRFAADEMVRVKRYILSAIEKDIVYAIDKEKLEVYGLPDLEVAVHLEEDGDTGIVGRVEYHYGEDVYEPAKGQVSPESVRDESKEGYVQKVLNYYGFEQVNDSYHLYETDQVYEWLTDGVNKLMQVAEVYISEKLRGKRIRKVKNVAVGIHLEGDWLNVDLSCLGIPREELLDMLASYRVKKKYYRLKNGDFVDLRSEGMNELDYVVDGLGLSEKDLEAEELKLQKYRALYLERLLDREGHIRQQKNADFKALVEDFDTYEEQVVALPSVFDGVFRTYQEDGYKWMKALGRYGFGGILADDMGLGKTLQTIGILVSEQGEGTSLVVCPTSLVYNWVAEFEKFAKAMKVVAVVGNQAEREALIQQAMDVDVMITSYDALKRDVEAYADYTFNYCIIDEAQYIKNSSTQNAKAVKQIESSKRIALTGTPIENRLSELWSIFDFVMPGYLYTEDVFRKRFELPITKDKDEGAMQRLRMMIAPFILRRLKTEVLEELPDKTESVVYSTLEEEQERIYASYVVKAREDLQKGASEGENNAIKVLAALTRMRQICCDPGLFLEDYTGGSGKLSSCLELIQQTVDTGHKVLLFSQFTSMLGRIGDALSTLGITYSLLTGDMKAKDRKACVEDFNEGDTQVFLISLKAGGVGLNLTSADVVIHYDPWWNVAAQNQATDRAYRIGQKNAVQVFKLIAKGTIEEKIQRMQADKQGLVDDVLSTEGKMLSQLSRDELLELFE